MHICSNCLENFTGVQPVPVGNERGSQMDPTRNTVDLCNDCATALVKGDFKKLHERYSETRTITR